MMAIMMMTNHEGDDDADCDNHDDVTGDDDDT